MVFWGNTIVIMLGTWIFFILTFQIIIVYGDDSSEDRSEDSGQDDDLLSAKLFRGISKRIQSKLDEWGAGRTLRYDDIEKLISDTSISNNQCRFRLTPDSDDLFEDKFLIGQLIHAHQIIVIQMSFHDENDDYIRDDNGNPIIYKSNRLEFGHAFLDTFHQDFTFAYVKCLLQLQPNSNFDLRSLFFHFVRSSRRDKQTEEGRSEKTSSDDPSAIITGPTLVFLDSPNQIYNVSTTCPSYLFCMWLLDAETILMSPNTSILISFSQKNIGNRTLKYTGYFGSVPRVLASLTISILESTTYVCNPVQKKIKNQWIEGVSMSSPRVYFTATVLDSSGYIIIAGGTADGLNPLSTVDIYNPATGCYNLSNITSARMKHTAVQFNSSDTVLLIGGVGQKNLVRETELISLNGAETSSSLQKSRYFHETAALYNENIVIVGGRSTNTAPSEMYVKSTDSYEWLPPINPILNNIEGHSVTSLGESNSALIFGGYNGSNYLKHAWIIEGINGNSTEISDIPIFVDPTAYHQATYLPSIRAVLITGGRSKTLAFRSCFLYYIDSGTFNTTGSMHVERAHHTAVRLSNGSVLVIGGVTSFDDNNQPIDVLRSVERYDVHTENFTVVNSLNVPRYGHKAVVGFQDKVFVFGGFDANGQVLSSVEYLKSYYTIMNDEGFPQVPDE